MKILQLLLAFVLFQSVFLGRRCADDAMCSHIAHECCNGIEEEAASDIGKCVKSDNTLSEMKCTPDDEGNNYCYDLNRFGNSMRRECKKLDGQKERYRICGPCKIPKLKKLK